MASEDAVVAQGLECSLCYEIFTQPKRLTCAHTFCKECLVDLYECHPQQNQISCPICRQITKINNGNISKLQTNIKINSMVEDMKSVERSCTVCDPEAKANAVQYCVQCDEYMCDSCTEAHGKFKKTAKHDVGSMDEVKRGKVKVKRFCTKHPEVEKLYVCTSCNLSICFRCRMRDHSNPDHEIKEVCDYTKTIHEHIKSLQEKATTGIESIDADIDLVMEQKAVVEDELDQRIAEIKQTYIEAVNHLKVQRDDLINRCKQEKASDIAQLEKIKESHENKMGCIRSASKLVGNGINALLEGQTLTVHKMICCDLEKILDASKPNTMQPKSIANRAKRFKFTKNRTSTSLGELQLHDCQFGIKAGMADHSCNVDATQHKTKANSAKRLKLTKSDIPTSRGELRLPHWQFQKKSQFRLSYADPRDAVPLHDGRVAIGYWAGHAIEMSTVDGPQKTVLEGVKVQRLSVLSDGRYVVRDDGNNITLYTKAWKKLNVRFNTCNQGGFAGMCVDRDDNIFVGYSKANKIDVFRPQGGAPSREIPCQKPWDICHMNHDKRLVVLDIMLKSVRVVNEEGTIRHRIKVEIEDTRIAVLEDDSLLIAYRKDGRMSIDLYTKDLKRIRTVLSDFPLGDGTCKLVALFTGEIAVVSERQFIAFRKI